MNIYTSSYRFARRLSDERYFLVSISRSVPRFFCGARLSALAPSRELLSDYQKCHNVDDYIRLYREDVLSHVDVRALLSSLCRYAHGRDMVLLCWESQEKFCHRHLLADYIFEKYGYRVKELS